MNTCGHCLQNYLGHHECPITQEGNVLPAKGEPMPQTISAWQRLYGLAEDAMKRDKDEISRLKQKVNQLGKKTVSRKDISSHIKKMESIEKIDCWDYENGFQDAINTFKAMLKACEDES